MPALESEIEAGARLSTIEAPRTGVLRHPGGGAIQIRGVQLYSHLNNN